MTSTDAKGDYFMARVVPSQVVDLINKHFPTIRSHTLEVDHRSVAVLMAIARLIDELPTELLMIVSRGVV